MVNFPQFIRRLRNFPWRNTAHTLKVRFSEDHLGLTAGSLTFTTTMALVPFFTVALAIFTAFPMFGALQDLLQRWLIDSLVPPPISKQVLGYLTQFANKASHLGGAGLAVLVVTAFALILTIDRTLNSIWRVKKPRPFAQRVLVYWGALTLGPIFLAASFALSSYALSATQGVVGAMPGSLRFLLNAFEFALLAAAMSALYQYVPNTHVQWGHAVAGGIFVASAVEIAKKTLVYYLGAVPTYSAVYGAFATVPILLIWIYVVWVIVLLGAVIAAYLPSLLLGVARRGDTPGWQFTLAIEVLTGLAGSDILAKGDDMALSPQALAKRLKVNPLQLEDVLETLLALGWIAQLDEPQGRYILLANPATTSMQPLIEKLLLSPSEATAFVQGRGLSSSATLASVLLK